MILYFTGTGNSEYAAKKLAAALGEEAMPLMERIRQALDNGTFAQFRQEYSEKLARRI